MRQRVRDLAGISFEEKLCGCIFSQPLTSSEVCGNVSKLLSCISDSDRTVIEDYMNDKLSDRELSNRWNVPYSYVDSKFSETCMHIKCNDSLMSILLFGKKSERPYLEELKLSNRTYGALLRGGIYTVRQLTLKTESQLLDINQLGEAAVSQIRRALLLYDLAIADEEPLEDVSYECVLWDKVYADEKRPYPEHLKENVDKLLTTLPEMDATIVRDKLFKNLTYDEVAEKFDITATSAYRHLNHVLYSMRHDEFFNSILTTGDGSIYENSLYRLRINSRIINSLKRAGIDDLQKLTERSDDDLLFTVRYIGPKAVNEIEEALKRIGLSLAPRAARMFGGLLCLRN